MGAPWNVGRREPRCARCATAFEEGAEHFSTVSVLGERLRREDSCPACFGGAPPPAEAFFWKTRYSTDRARRARIDLEALREAFLRLEASAEGTPLRYLVCLLLLRKRVLRVRHVRRGTGGEPDVLEVSVGRKGEVHRVPVPDLPPGRIEELRDSLRELMGLREPPGGPAAPDSGESRRKNCGNGVGNAIIESSRKHRSTCK